MGGHPTAGVMMSEGLGEPGAKVTIITSQPWCRGEISGAANSIAKAENGPTNALRGRLTGKARDM
jgi:hypothetical protein